MVPEVKAVFGRVTVDHPFFDYVSAFEKQVISRAISEGRAVVVSFMQGANHLFAVILDVEKNAIHVRECGGAFVRNFKFLFVLTQALAKSLQKQFVTIAHTPKGTEYLAKKLGFSRNAVNDLSFEVK